MQRIITIHQPDFLPWLGFFKRWRDSDLYVVLDDVQYLRRGWQNRDRIKTANGTQWLTVPVRKSGRYDQQIREVELEAGNWRSKHLRTMRAAYAKAPNFDKTFKALEALYLQGFEKLIDFNMSLLEWAASELGVATPVRFSSELCVASLKTERLVDLTQAVDGTVYSTGTGSRAYLEEDLFAARGIEVRWQQWAPPPYPQLHGEYVPMLSVIDFIMMHTDPAAAFDAACGAGQE